MAEIHLDEYQTRVAKLQQIRTLGSSGYAHKFVQSHSIAELHTLSKETQLPEAEYLMAHGAQKKYSIA